MENFEHKLLGYQASKNFLNNFFRISIKKFIFINIFAAFTKQCIQRQKKTTRPRELMSLCLVWVCELDPNSKSKPTLKVNRGHLYVQYFTFLLAYDEDLNGQKKVPNINQKDIFQHYVLSFVKTVFSYENVPCKLILA